MTCETCSLLVEERGGFLVLFVQDLLVTAMIKHQQIKSWKMQIKKAFEVIALPISGHGVWQVHCRQRRRDVRKALRTCVPARDRGTSACQLDGFISSRSCISFQTLTRVATPLVDLTIGCTRSSIPTRSAFLYPASLRTIIHDQWHTKHMSRHDSD